MNELTFYDQPDQENVVKFSQGRDHLGMLEENRTTDNFFDYEPSESDIEWLERQLKRYCGHYFPFLGVIRNEQVASRWGRNFYNLLRAYNTFGAVYLLLTMNLPPLFAVEMLNTDFTRQYLRENHADVLEKIGEPGIDVTTTVYRALRDDALFHMQGESYSNALARCTRKASS